METRLRELREEAGRSVHEMASVFGVGDSTYRKWELGTNEMTYSRACEVADYFKVTLDELAGRTVPHLSRDEEELVACYRAANPQGRTAITSVARSMRGTGRLSEPSRGGMRTA